MKQFILNYRDFLNSQKLDESRLSPEQAEKYSKIKVVKNVKELHDKIFGDQERIYLPFDFNIFQKTTKSLTQQRIEKLFADANIEIISYEQNQCKKPDNKNIFKIGKLLQDAKHFNNEDLAMDYGEDVEKTRGVQESYDMFIVISRNNIDIASMSTNRAWRSCQNLNGGSHNRYVAKDLEQGSIVAYIIKADDKEIDDPEARILIKPFVNSNNADDVVLLPATASYYRGKGIDYNAVEKYPKFYDFLMSWVKSVQPNLKGSYTMQKDVYQDGRTYTTIKKDMTVEDIEILENPKTKEDIEFCFDTYGLNYSYVKYDEDNFINYGSNISLTGDYRTPPAFLKYIKTIKGNLSFSNGKGSPRLRNLKNLENLESVKTLDIRDTKILKYKKDENEKLVLDVEKTLKEFEGLKCSIKEIVPNNLTNPYFLLKNPKFEETLKNPKTKEDFISILNFYDIDIDSSAIKINENNKIDYNYTLIFNNKPYEDVKNVLKHFENIKVLELNGISIDNFKGFEHIKSIDILKCNWATSINSFEGLKNVKIQSITCKSDVRGKYFEMKYPNLEEIVKNPKNVQETLIALDYEDVVDLENIKVDEDGLINYNGNYRNPKNLNYLKYFKTINILNISEEDFTDIKFLSNLESVSEVLIISNCKNLKSLDGLEKLKNLKYLGFEYCENLTDLKVLKNIETLGSLSLMGCVSLESLNGLENIKEVDVIDLKRCEKLKDISALKNIKTINKLNLNDCYNLTSLNGLENLETCGKLNLYKTDLESLNGLEKLKEVDVIDLTVCKNLKDISALKNLKKIKETLSLPQTLEDFTGLENVRINDVVGDNIFLKIAEVNKYIKKSLETPKTKKDFKLIEKIYSVSIDPSNIIKDENGLWSYDGSIIFKKTNDSNPIKSFPKFFKNLKSVTDNFGFSIGFKELAKDVTSLENLENLEEVGKTLGLYGSSITSLKELKSLKKIGDVITLPEDFEAFEDLENIEIVGEIQPQNVKEKYLKFKNPNLEEILENPKTIEDFKTIKDFYNLDNSELNINSIEELEDGFFSYKERALEFKPKEYVNRKAFTSKFKNIDNLNILWGDKVTSLKGLENLETAKNITISGLEIEDFTGLENLKTVKNLEIKYFDKIKDFTGLKNIESIEDLELSRCNELSSFKGLENLKSLNSISIWYCNKLKTFEGLPKNLKDVIINPPSYIKQYELYTNPKLQETLDNPKTIEDFKTIKDFYSYDNNVLDVSKVEMDSDGLWTYDGGIDFSRNTDFTEFPKWVKNLKEIKGSLGCSQTPLESFNGLENLQIIGGDLKCYRTLLESFKGLGNLKSIGKDFYCSDTSIKDFNGLENLKTIGEGLYCNFTPLESFVGLENLQTIGGDLKCYGTPLKDFNGLERLKKIGKDLDCKNTSIKDFTGLSKDIKINGSIEPKELQEILKQYKNS